jgi:hypothetical protein
MNCSIYTPFPKVQGNFCLPLSPLPLIRFQFRLTDTFNRTQVNRRQTNIQWRRERTFIGCSMLDVECWMFPMSQTTNPAVMPFLWSDPVPGWSPARFFRVSYEP